MERPTTAELVRLSRELLGPQGMTKHRSTFSRRDAIQRWATLHRQGESADRIVALTDRWLAQSVIVALEADSGTPGGLGDQLPLALADPREELRYSTRTLLAIEHALLATAARRRHEGVAVVPSETVVGALAAHPSLTDEQVALVWELTSSGHGIENVEAGAGKTHALRVAVAAFVAAGHPVLGTSTSNLATRTLEHEAACGR